MNRIQHFPGLKTLRKSLPKQEKCITDLEAHDLVWFDTSHNKILTHTIISIITQKHICKYVHILRIFLKYKNPHVTHSQMKCINTLINSKDWSPSAHKHFTAHLFPIAIVIHEWVAGWPRAWKCTKHDCWCCSFNSVLSTVLRSVHVPKLPSHTHSYRCTFSSVVFYSRTSQTDFTLTPTPLMQTKTEPILEPCMGVVSAALGETMLGILGGVRWG